MIAPRLRNWVRLQLAHAAYFAGDVMAGRGNQLHEWSLDQFRRQGRRK